MLPLVAPTAAHATGPSATPTAGSASPSSPTTTSAPTASAASDDCLRVDPADTRPADQLRGKDARRSGHAAVVALGSRLPQAAALNRQSVTALTAVLEHDPTARLDGCARLLYVETPPAASDLAAADAAAGPVTDPAPGTVSLAQAFALNSRPGSSRTIYLDFLGGTYNGSFVCQYATAPCTLPAFTQDGDATTFSATELVAIYRIWQSVAEDYAPFDVNVTTQDPGSAAIDRASLADTVYGVRAVISSDSVWAGGCGCGGMAYVGVWGSTSSAYYSYEKPTAVVVTANLGGGGAKYVAEATSHEVGHNFGLNHDGTVTHDGIAAVGYYAGQGTWAPIMGNSYGKPITQWSKGEYTYANNTQDDTAIIATGAPLMTDDVGSTAGTATALANNTSVSGLITSPTDSDWFSFTSLGVTQLSVTPAATNPNLDVSLEVRASDGTAVLETWNPTVSGSQSSSLATSVAGLEAHRTTLALDPGTYFARVTGTGEGSAPATGYSSYDSLGRYTIAMSTTSVGPLAVTPTTPAPVVTGTAYSWTASTTGGSGYPVTWAVTSGTLPTGLSLTTGGKVSGTATTAGSKTITLTTTEAVTLATASASVTFTVYNPVSVANATLPVGVVGSAYSTKLTSTGGGATPTWTLWTGSTAPAGLSLATDGTLSGTPTTNLAGYSFLVLASDSVTGTSKIASMSLTVWPALVVTSAALPDAATGAAVSDTVYASGGTGTATWSITAGSLPPGLSLTPSAGSATISGTPTTTGTYPFTLSATNAATAASAGGSASASLSIRVAEPIVVSDTAPPVGGAGAAYTTSVTAVGGIGTLTFSIGGGTLPGTITLSPDGVLTGTAPAAGTYQIYVTATDSRGVTGSRWVTLSFVDQLQITASGVGTILVGSAPTATIQSTGGTGGAIHWSVSKGALPPGITLTDEDSGSPTLSGSATTTGSYDFTLAVDNVGAVTHAERDFTLVVNPLLAPATCALAPAMVGIAYAGTVPVNGGIAPYAITASTTLPAGLSLDSAGHLTGTPTAAAATTFGVDVYDALSEAAWQQCSLTVLPRLLVTTTSVAQPTLSKAYAVWLTAVGGGTSPRTWTLASGALPSGITLSSTGRLSGTPTRTGSFYVTARVATADGFAATKSLRIIVARALVISSPSALSVAHRYRSYSVRLVASGGYSTRTWAKLSGSLPRGLKLSSAGVVYGKATRTGTYVMTVKARDAVGRIATKRITIVVRV
jgi:hypothetical protein